jgi:hypothetical protein
MEKKENETLEIGEDDWCIKINGKTGEMQMVVPNKEDIDLKEMIAVMRGIAKLLDTWTFVFQELAESEDEKTYDELKKDFDDAVDTLQARCKHPAERCNDYTTIPGGDFTEHICTTCGKILSVVPSKRAKEP